MRFILNRTNLCRTEIKRTVNKSTYYRNQIQFITEKNKYRHMKI